MQAKFVNLTILAVLLICRLTPCLAAKSSDPNNTTKYLDAVRTFADNVLKYGRDTYGPKHTPLFVDGLNIHTHEPVKWIAPNGDRWILSNLASQQNLFRTLDGLTKITGDPKYKQAAMEAIKYAFENLRHPNGLLYWGLSTAYDAATEEVCGDKRATSFKACYPYYELMWEVNFKVTKQFIEALWSVHILDWRNLDMDRIAYFNEPLEKAWDYDYEGGAVFFKSKRGTSFDTTASDLYYASVFLYSVSGQKDPLIWSKRLAHRYVETRNPKTGISATIYSVNPRRTPPAIDSSGNWVVEFWHFLGDPEIRDGLYGQLTVSPGLLTNLYGNLSICQLMLGEMLGYNGTEFKRWAHEELAARGRAAYRTESNQWIPMLTDGTNLEGVEGRVGRPMVACPADTIDFWSYALAFKVTGDKFMWEMSRNIAQGNGLGDIGFSSADEPRLLLQSDCLCPFAILGFLELYKATQREQFLEMGNRIGDNILANKFHKGFFLPTKNYIYAQFNAIEALVLLHLHSAGESEGARPPQVWPSRVYFVGPYRGKESGIDQQEIYSLTETTEPPVSIGEAARMCDIKLIKLLIAQGENIDKREERFFRTALHYATIEGHISIVELLLAEGANVNAGDYDNDTPLHDAAKRGHKQIAELLIAKGANVNAKNRDGQTPLHYTERGQKDIVELLIANGADINAKNYNGQTPLDIAISRNHKEIVELLIKNGADVSLHTASRVGALAKVKSLIEKGADINAKNTSGRTALHYAAEHGRKDIAELLIARGADVNVEDKDGNTPGHVALGKSHRPTLDLLIAKGVNFTSIHLSAYQGNLDEVRSFIAKGADVNAKDISGETPLHKAAIAGHKDVVGLLIEKGADVNAKDRWGCVPLHCMAGDNNKDMVEFLIAKGADVNTEDNWGETPLEVANDKGHTEIVNLLKKHTSENTDVTEIKSQSMALSSNPAFLDTKPDLILTGPSESYTQYGNYPRFGDVNGDGYEDLLVAGASRYNNNQGRIYLYYGGTDMDDIADIILTGENSGDDYKTGENPGDYFGEDGYLADVNGDGYADVITSAFAYNNRRGRVYIFHGSPDIDENADLIIDGETGTKGAFGLALTAGDVNNDNYDDVIITASSFNNKTGRVYLFYGGNPMDTTVDLIFDGENENDRFGRDINNPKMVGDVNGDGYGDLLISTRTWNFWEGVSGQGRTYLYYGGPGTSMDSIPDKIFTGENERDDFGVSGCIFDIDNDGFGDVIIGARAYNRRGRVYLYWGGEDMDTIADKTFDGEAGTKHGFGCGIDAGYVNDDDFGDILITAPYSNTGKAYLFYGDKRALMNTVCDKTFTLPKGTNFPQHVVLGDLHNDNYPDVAIGGYHYNNGQGRVWIYFNKPPKSK